MCALHSHQGCNAHTTQASTKRQAPRSDCLQSGGLGSGTTEELLSGVTSTPSVAGAVWPHRLSVSRCESDQACSCVYCFDLSPPH